MFPFYFTRLYLIIVFGSKFHLTHNYSYLLFNKKIDWINNLIYKNITWNKYV